MANTVVINSITPEGDVLTAKGTVNGATVAASVSAAIFNSISNGTLSQQYLAIKLMEAAPEAITQNAISISTGTVSI